MWKRRLCAIVLLVAVLPSAQPCCGGFSEYGLENDPLTGNLERFYLHLVRPGKTLDQVTSDGETSANRALADEDAGDWTRAQDDWQEAMHGIDCESASAWRLREIRDRLDLLPVVGGMIPAALWHRYAVAAYHQTDLYRRVDVTAIAPDLLALTTDANQPIAAAALTSIAWRELQAGQMPAARAHLASAATLDPQGAKGDEIGYLQVIAPIYAHAGNGWGIDDPAGTLNAIQAWLTAHPSSPWRFHARSWQAGILYHHRELAWGQDSDGLFAAVRIWQHLLLTAQADELFVPAVESLRFAYRKMRPAPPAWVVADPRHAAAFYWHAFTDPSYGWADAPGQDLDAKRKAMLADAAPAMARFAASDADPALMEAVADTWIAAGHPEVALPLASRALGAMPSPRLRYEVARLQADAGDATAAAATIAGGAIDGDVGDPRPLPGAERFDLLVRIGGDWEIHGDWHRALRAYIDAHARYDVAVLAGGTMPLPALGQEIASGGDFRSPADDGMPSYYDATADGNDFLPSLRHYYAVRLVWAGRERDALPYFTGDARGILAGLIDDEDALAHATTDAGRADALWTLAMAWYTQGKKVAFADRYWHQWAESDWHDPHEPPKPDAATLAQAMEAMNVYWRAYPLFLELADIYPTSPHAADALYHAALCRYWPCGENYMSLSDWWIDRAKCEHFWTQGDDLLRRLAVAYPTDLLAHDPKVVRAVAHERPEEMTDF